MIVFNRNVEEKDKTNIAAMFGCKDTKQYERYLDILQLLAGPKRGLSMKTRLNFDNAYRPRKINYYPRLGKRCSSKW